MNSLGVNLEVGQKVVMQGNGNEEHRTVIITGGFGMDRYTMGTGLFVKLQDGTNGKMDATEIEKVVK